MKAVRWLLALVLLVVVPACGPTPPPAPRCLTVVLPDRSLSVNEPTIRTLYEANIEVVVQGVAAEGGVLIADVIDGRPLGHTTPLIYQDFAPSPDLPDNPAYLEPDRALKVEAALKQLVALFDLPPSEQTDIIAALLVAQRLFEAHARLYTCRRLVLLSDMVQDGGGVLPSFYKTNVFTDAAVARLLTRARQAGLVAHLPVRVLVGGAGADTNGGLPPQRTLGIATFWAAYFREAGSKLSGGWYATRLVSIQ